MGANNLSSTFFSLTPASPNPEPRRYDHLKQRLIIPHLSFKKKNIFYARQKILSSVPVSGQRLVP